MQTSYNTQPVVGVKGMVADGRPHEIISKRANGVCRIGCYAVLGSNGDAAHPSAEPTPLNRGGIVVRDAYRVRSTDDDEDIADNEMFGLLTEGPIWVECESGSPGVENTQAYVRITAGGAGQVVGNIRADDDSGAAVAIPGLVFRSSGQICLLEVRKSSYVEPAGSA